MNFFSLNQNSGLFAFLTKKKIILNLKYLIFFQFRTGDGSV